MGARINFVFKDSEDGPSVVLYSHWGQTYWQPEIAYALRHAKARWQDSSYGIRMMISYLIKDSVMDETGFGLFAVNADHYELGEQTIIIDFTNQTVTDIHPVKWEAFINAYGGEG